MPSSASLRSFIDMGTSRSFRLPTVVAIDGQNSTGAHLDDAVRENGSILPIVRDVYGGQIQAYAAAARVRFASSARSSASRLDSGSSSNSTRGSPTIARASATRCCSPPESW